MARDLKLSFLFGTGTLGTSTIAAAPGANVVSYYGAFSPGAAATVATSCPLAYGGWSKTAVLGRPQYAEDTPDAGGIVLPGNSNRNDLFAIVDATIASTVTSQTFSVQASTDLITWVTVGTADTNVPTTTVAAGTPAVTNAAIAAGVFTSAAAHGFAVGDIVYVSTAGTGQYGPAFSLAVAAVGQLSEVASVPSTTTFTLRPLSSQPAPVVNNAMVSGSVYASNGTATIQFIKLRTSDIGRQFVIPISPTARPYLRLACTSNGAAGGIIAIRDAYIANSRIGAVV
jgi:hypothetical protein